MRETALKIRRRVATVEGVRECEVRVDSTGKKPHVSVRLLLAHAPSYEKIHSISSRVDHEVRGILPNARVIVRSAQEARWSRDSEDVWNLVRRIADHEPGSRGAHNIHLQNLQGRLGVDFHLEVSSALTVAQAHEVAERIEDKLKAADPKISEVIIHEETISDRISSERSGHGSELKWYIDHVVKNFPDATLTRPPSIRRLADGQVHVIVRVSFRPDMSMEKANQLMSKLETAIKSGYSKIVRLDIVNEPLGDEATKPRAR